MELVLTAPIILLGFYFLYRNNCVYRYIQQQIDIAHSLGMEDIDNHTYKGPRFYYNQIPDYGVMLYRFWVWPLSKFGGVKQKPRKLLTLISSK